jgi:hypothetical protein
LEFKRQMRSRTAEHQVQSTISRFCRHVESLPVWSLARYLAVNARVFAPERCHEDVQLRKAVKETSLGPVFGCEDIQQGGGLAVKHEVTGTE